jgi:hypothetical protein
MFFDENQTILAPTKVRVHEPQKFNHKTPFSTSYLQKKSEKHSFFKKSIEDRDF